MSIDTSNLAAGDYIILPVAGIPCSWPKRSKFGLVDLEIKLMSSTLLEVYHLYSTVPFIAILLIVKAINNEWLKCPIIDLEIYLRFFFFVFPQFSSTAS